MKKIPSLFQRNYDGDKLVRNEVVPGSEWVLAGEGWASIKIDGTRCLFQDGKLWKRYDVKKGRTAPPDFLPAQDADPVTGHWPGWVPVGNGPGDQYHREAMFNPENSELMDGATYELIGPKVQGNPHLCKSHVLLQHGCFPLGGVPRDYDGLKAYLSWKEIEGVVWRREGGDMVKVKRRDFGFPWPVRMVGAIEESVSPVSDEQRIAQITAKLAEASGTHHPAFTDMSYLLSVVERLMAENVELRRMKPVADAALSYRQVQLEYKANFDMIYQSAKDLDVAIVGYLDTKGVMSNER